MARPWGTLVFKTGSLDRQPFHLTCQSSLHRNSLIHKIKWNGFPIHRGVWPEFSGVAGWWKVHYKAASVEVLGFRKGKSFQMWFCFSDNFPHLSLIFCSHTHTTTFLGWIWGLDPFNEKKVTVKALISDLVKPFINALFIIVWPPGC